VTVRTLSAARSVSDRPMAAMGWAQPRTTSMRAHEFVRTR
jgi:hypothetical protein